MAEMIVSGRRYRIVEVAGRSEFVLDDLLGDRTFVITAAGEKHVITGVGAASPTGVRFYEKDPEHKGKDVRVWRITRANDIFIAEHVAAI